MISADIDLGILSNMKTNSGKSLKEVSEDQPVLLVFLRHFGCVFCKEAMADLSALKGEINEKEFKLVFVHMAENKVAQDYLDDFNLGDSLHISDPDCKFYTAFRLTKGSFSQLYGLQTWIRGFSKENKNHKLQMAKALGDSTQMPEHFIHKFAADRPDYGQLLNSCKIS